MTSCAARPLTSAAVLFRPGPPPQRQRAQQQQALLLWLAGVLCCCPRRLATRTLSPRRGRLPAARDRVAARAGPESRPRNPQDLRQHPRIPGYAQMCRTGSSLAASLRGNPTIDIWSAVICYSYLCLDAISIVRTVQKTTRTPTPHPACAPVSVPVSEQTPLCIPGLPDGLWAPPG